MVVGSNPASRIPKISSSFRHKKAGHSPRFFVCRAAGLERAILDTSTADAGRGVRAYHDVGRAIGALALAEASTYKKRRAFARILAIDRLAAPTSQTPQPRRAIVHAAALDHTIAKEALGVRGAMRVVAASHTRQIGQRARASRAHRRFGAIRALGALPERASLIGVLGAYIRRIFLNRVCGVFVFDRICNVFDGIRSVF